MQSFICFNAPVSTKNCEYNIDTIAVCFQGKIKNFKNLDTTTTYTKNLYIYMSPSNRALRVSLERVTGWEMTFEIVERGVGVFLD